MRALQFRKSIPRYAMLKLAGSRLRRRCAPSLAPVALRDIPEPKLPNPQWVRIAPNLAGICGSDVATVCATGSPYLAPVTSMPFVLGHELVGRVTEIGPEVQGLSRGDRVVVQPALGCAVRGVEPPCAACQAGRSALCRNVTRGVVSAGIQTGYCRDTGGGFGESLVAHQSQVYPVPKDIDDEAAVLIEPFACALHGALCVSLSAQDTVAVIGCGSIGLLTIAALRAVGCLARIVAVARYDHQKELATALGADELLETGGSTSQRYHAWAKALDAEILKPELGKPTVLGGAAAVFDCVGSSQTIDDGIRFTRSAGTFVLVGMPGIPAGLDLTPLWFQELTIHAAYAYGPEQCADGPRDTFPIAIDLMRTWGARLKRLTSTAFRLEEYREAFAAAVSTGASRNVKTVFAIGNG